MLGLPLTLGISRRARIHRGTQFLHKRSCTAPQIEHVSYEIYRPILSKAYSDYYPKVAVEGIDIECLNACQEKHYTITG